VCVLSVKQYITLNDVCILEGGQTVSAVCPSAAVAMAVGGRLISKVDPVVALDVHDEAIQRVEQ
jgi:hypothetical protein